MLPTELAATLEQRLATLAPEVARTMECHPHATIVPTHGTPDSAGQRAVAELAGLTGLARSLTLEGTLGEGGMGVVHLATQRSLGRKVAVKTLRREHQTPAATMKLLREAWVIGALEHPNVLPVYDVEVDADGVPHIVLKRIEGEPWSKLLETPTAPRERLGDDAFVERHLDILMQVARATHFAHSRGIIHRDLKPENVMVGAFGEVYLLDWGIALSLRDDESGRLPVAGTSHGLAGTPCYMAPEMLGSEIGPLSERSDVYLLGAILHEITHGRPPHEASDAIAIVASILRSEAAVDRAVPAELASIARRAMDRDPERRFASAETFRLAVQDYLRQRSSLRLAERAERRLSELEAWLASPEPTQAWRAQLYNLFGACRFGFREALAAAPHLTVAAEGLARATRTMIDHELGAGDARAAASLLAEMASPPPALTARVEAALTAAEVRRERVEELERQLDPRVGQRTRWFLALVLGVLWTATPAVLSRALPAAHDDSSLSILLGGVVFLAIIGALGIWARDSMTKTTINRQLGAGAVVACLAYIAIGLGGVVAPWPQAISVTVVLVVWSAICAMLSHGVERRLAPSAVGYLAAFFAAAAWPEHRFDIQSASHLVLTVNVVAIWRPSDPAPRLRRLVRSHVDAVRGRGRTTGEEDVARDSTAPPR